jgi:hypothetical protein
MVLKEVAAIVIPNISEGQSKVPHAGVIGTNISTRH